MEGARRLADQVRVGLDQVQPTLQEAGMTYANDDKAPVLGALDQTYFGRPIRQHIKEFAAILATISFAIAAAKLYKHAPVAVFAGWVAGGVIITALGYLVPIVLLPVWRAWMKLAHVLSIVMTCVILGLVWTIGFVPMALVLKALRIKTIDTSFRANVDSYWEKRDVKYDDFRRLEQQF